VIFHQMIMKLESSVAKMMFSRLPPDSNTTKQNNVDKSEAIGQSIGHVGIYIYIHSLKEMSKSQGTLVICVLYQLSKPKYTLS
jgi:hypothetical protein